MRMTRWTAIFLTVVFLFGIAASAMSAAPQQVNEKVNVLIGFHEEPNPGLVEAFGGEIYREFTIVDTIAATMTQQKADALARQPGVKHVEPDAPVYALETAVMTEEKTVPWGIDRLFGDETYSFPTWDASTGEGVGVAILDTGIDEDHIDLEVAGGVNFTRGRKDDYSDKHGHGTHVGGTVAALDDGVIATPEEVDYVVGVAPQVDLYAVKVLGNSGIGWTSDIIAGIEWAVDNRIPVLNMSLGSSSYNTDFDEACQEAYKAGHLLVAAAGNSGDADDEDGNVSYPAAYESVIAVAASDKDDNRADFSSTGPEVELIAPGVDVWSTWPDDEYHKGKGTSMASPHVAGVAALVWAADTELSNIDIRKILLDTAESLELDESYQGKGLVRADVAVAAALDVEDVHYVEITEFEVTEEVLQGEDVDIQVTFKNTGDYDETVNLKVWNKDTEEVFEEKKELALNVGETYEVKATWETDEADADDYTIEAWIEAIDDGGGVLTKDERTETVTVKEPEHIIAITELTGDTVEQGETAEINVTVANEGDYDYTGDDYVELTVTVITNENTEELLLNGVLELASGGSVTVTATWETDEDTEAKDYEIEAEVNAKVDEEIKASDSETATVTVVEEAALEIVKFEVKDTSNPVWARVEVEWEVYDGGDNLEKVVLEVLDDEGDTTTDKTIDVSGEEASGVDELRMRNAHDEFVKVKITVFSSDDKVSETQEIKG